MNKKFSGIWGVIRPYWVSRDRWVGLGLLSLILIMLLLGVKFQAWQSEFTKDMYDAIDKRDAKAFRALSILAVVVLLSYAAMSAAKSYVDQFLQIRWRQGLTEYFLTRWFNERNFFRIERSQLVDNPDQRIAEDVRMFVDSTMTLTFAFLSNAGMLYVFGPLLWKLAGSITLTPTSTVNWTIDGYLFWVAVVYALGQTLLSHLVGNRLITLTVRQQKAEADFRHAMVQQRDHAEQLAFYDAGKVEYSRLQRLFGEIRVNFRHIMTKTKYLNFVTQGALVIQVLIPTFAVSPKLFSGEMSMGEVLQSQGAFLGFCMAVAWFGIFYPQIVAWLAVSRRLVRLNAVLDAPAVSGIEVIPSSDSGVGSKQLKLWLPDATPLLTVGGFKFESGQRWLVRGPSGAGKSTFLRALAGLWPHGDGRVDVPAGATMQFMPQRCYVPDGTLKEALAYPAAVGAYDNDRCLRALNDCLLGHLAARLHEPARWSQQLSPGEQQRLAFARVLLRAPDFLFADEATSALDVPTEQHLMALLIERFPELALISVSHRPTLDMFHSHELVFDGAGGVRGGPRVRGADAGEGGPGGCAALVDRGVTAG